MTRASRCACRRVARLARSPALRPRLRRNARRTNMKHTKKDATAEYFGFVFNSGLLSQIATQSQTDTTGPPPPPTTTVPVGPGPVPVPVPDRSDRWTGTGDRWSLTYRPTTRPVPVVVPTRGGPGILYRSTVSKSELERVQKRCEDVSKVARIITNL